MPEQIIVEFTESEVISRFDEFAEAIKSLKAAGISVAIDHFGAGLLVCYSCHASSLTELKSVRN